MNFLHPEFFAILLVLPLYFGWWYWQKKKRAQGLLVSVFQDFKQAQCGVAHKIWKGVDRFLIVLIVVLFAITLARPQGAHEKQEVSKTGIDIIFALDVSGSMLAEDLTPNRIEAAKEHIKEFLGSLEHDRVGIVVFSGQAFTQSPLSFDYHILTEYLDQISTESINQRVRGLNGTAVGDAILAAIKRFEKSADRSKVLVLLTDGDANAGVNPEVASRMARQENIKIYAIGIGKKGGAPMVFKDFMGQKQVARDRFGRVVMATFNEKALERIAQVGEGRYYRVEDNEGLKQVLDAIGTLEKKEIEVNTVVEYSEDFMPWMYGLLGCVGIWLGGRVLRQRYG